MYHSRATKTVLLVSRNRLTDYTFYATLDTTQTSPNNYSV